MRGSFSLFGFRISVRPEFLLIAGLLSFSYRNAPAQMAVAVVVLFLAILIHELGHAFAFKRYGIHSEIELHGFGGHCMPLNGVPKTQFQSIVVSLAGPFVGLLVPLFAFLATLALRFSAVEAPPLLTFGLEIAIFYPLILNLFNLLPIWPLDGGKVAESLFSYILPVSYRTHTHILSLLVCAALAYFALQWNSIFTMIIIAQIFLLNFSALKAARA